MTAPVLCRFPVLRASEVAAEGRFTRSMRRAEERLRRQYGTSLEGLPEEVRERFERRYRWQQWPHNHVCGWIDLVAADTASLRADIHLARRALPRDHAEHHWHVPRLGDEVVLYARGPEVLVMPGNNISYREVAALLLDESQQIVRAEGCGTRSAVVSLDPPLEAIDLVWIHRQRLEKATSRSGGQGSLL